MLKSDLCVKPRDGIPYFTLNLSLKSYSMAGPNNKRVQGECTYDVATAPRTSQGRPYQKLLGKRVGVDGEVEYLVQWVPTWEKAGNISNLTESAWALKIWQDGASSDSQKCTCDQRPAQVQTAVLRQVYGTLFRSHSLLTAR